MHTIYINYGKYNFLSQITQMIYSTIISEIFDVLFKGLAITFGICFVFSFIYYIQTFRGLFADYIWGYLWYVPFFLLVLAIYYILRSIVKNTKAFNILTVVLITITLSITLSEISTSGILRGIAGIGIGILISQIPKLNFKNSNIVSFIVFSILLSTLVVVSIFFVDARYEAPLCILILFPSIIYFANNANFSNIIINKFCMLSFGLYAYQTVVRWLEYNAIVTDSRIMFLIVVGLAILDLLIKAIVKHIVINKKRDHAQKTTVLPL